MLIDLQELFVLNRIIFIFYLIIKKLIIKTLNINKIYSNVCISIFEFFNYLNKQ